MGAESCQDDLYKEIRVENTLQDEDGEPVPDAVDFPVATPFPLPISKNSPYTSPTSPEVCEQADETVEYTVCSRLTCERYRKLKRELAS